MSKGTLHIVSSDGRVTLGRGTEFALVGVERLSEARFVVKHDGVLYPDPLISSTPASVRFAPEAPGDYTISALWRDVHGGSGRAEVAFTVDGPASTGAPERVRIPDGLSVWTPSQWEAALATRHEERALTAVRRLVRPGATVYDIGANIGLFATRFAKWVGASGQLYCVEPNPLCVYFLKTNLYSAGARNFEILPVCLTDSARSIEFSVNYGSSVLGMAPDSTVPVKPGHRIVVEGTSLDTVIETLRLRAPDVIKVDVEGAEGAVVAGMKATLSRYTPALMIELHGVAAARAALAHLAPLGYRYQEISGGRQFASTSELAAWMPDACVQVLALRGVGGTAE
jgi:FkbM family methyltransferase